MTSRGDYFELFGLTPGFAVDGETLALRYRELQRAVHPDRYAGASDRERRLSMQQTALINEAYRTLRDPLARARYLLELQGIPFDENGAMDPAFLMEQMELREALQSVRDSDDPFAALTGVRERAEARERELAGDLAARFVEESPETLEQVPDLIRKLQFIRKLVDEADEMEEALVHSAG